MFDNTTFNNTNNISKHTNQYATDVVNNHKISKISYRRKTYYNFIDDAVLNKHNTIYTNVSINVTKISKLVNLNDHNYFTKKREHANNIINNITRHNHNNH